MITIIETFKKTLTPGIKFIRSFSQMMLGIFWISYAVTTGLITEEIGSAISSTFLLSVLIVFFVRGVSLGTYKIGLKVIEGDVFELSKTFGDFDVILLMFALTFSTLPFITPRFLFSDNVLLNSFIILFSCEFTITGIFYILICLTTRKILRPSNLFGNKWMTLN